MNAFKKSSVAVSLALATVVALSGCVGAASPQAVQNSGADSGSAIGSKTGGPSDLAAPTGGSASSDASVIKNASVAVAVANPVEAGNQAQKVAQKYSGKIDSQSQVSNNAGEIYQVNLALRVDAKMLEVAIDEIKALGTVTQVDISALDVTVSVLDLEARKKSLVASIARLTALMAKAETTAALIEAENVLTQRQGELESIDSQLRYFADQVSLSTVNVSLTKLNSGPQAAPQNFVDGLKLGWQSIVAAAAGVVVGLGIVLPWVILVALVGGGAFLLIRRLKRKNRD
ncbi:DUF4349 domain-containing protein [Rhodoluna sp.]|uniref:DUF4349 domain-containing protein n=1 Tax=Rhodoluna sp. TaxID=1969481 RepID=UPI0025DA366F|nr:DUF4349 domain-containing protein [Rhodoluna sp.]